MLAVGLGNPGAEYRGTRHNLGAEVVAVLAARYGAGLRRSPQRALTTEVRVDGRLLALAFPQTYMNLSGESVALLMRRYGVEAEPARLVVVHDELDLPSGRIKVKQGGGIAGHNGLASIKAHLRSADFIRIRIGIGKPPGRQPGTDHVLRRPVKAERAGFAMAVEEAADAVELILSNGVAAAMNQFNPDPPPVPKDS